MDKKELNQICYLCGNPFLLDEENINRDHVPPRQFFADEIRKNHNPNLLTLPVHKNCNSSYQIDEDYLANSLVPFAIGSYSANAYFLEMKENIKKGKKLGLMFKIVKEFEFRPSGLYLPNNKMIKRMEGKRIQRVIWKIVRGLYFYHFNHVIPETLKGDFRVIFPGDQIPPDFADIVSEPTHGKYPGVFDYRFIKIPDSLENNLYNYHYWALLLWDKILFLVVFQYPPIDFLAN